MSGSILLYGRWLVVGAGLMSLLGCTSTNSPSNVAASTASSPVQQSATDPAQSASQGDLVLVGDLPAPAATAGGTEQPVSPADVLEVFIFQVPDLSRTVQVDSAGRINLPLIGTMHVAGKGVTAVADMITKAYAANYLQNPQVSVMIKSSASMRVTVDGEVNRAGVFPLPPTATLVDAIALAGGLSRVADTSRLYIFRKIEGRTLVANYSLDQIRQGSRPNPRIFGGDVVVVFSSSGKVAMQNLREALGMVVPVAALAIP